MIVARVLLITVMIALGSIAQVSAFSLGPINVKSKFGERFGENDRYFLSVLTYFDNLYLFSILRKLLSLFFRK